MRTTQYKDYTITVQSEPRYTPGSADNLPYDKVIVLEKDIEAAKCLSLQIEKDGEVTSVIFIAPYCASVYDIIIPREDGLILTLGSEICLFDIEKLEVIKSVDLHKSGWVGECVPYQDDFIVHGELYIFRISKDLEIVWEFGARDIWVRYQGEEPAFEIKEDRICLYDFMDNYYELDFDGKLIKEELSPAQQELMKKG